MTRRDTRRAAELHLQHLNHGLFPALGGRFLAAYLETFVNSQFASALVAESEGTVVGFLVGTIDDRAHYRRVLRRYGPRLAVRALVALAVRPAVAVRFLRTRVARYARGMLRLAGTSGAAAPGTRDAVLNHLAVESSSRNGGVGTRLVEAFLVELSSADVDGVRLATRLSPKGATSFYEKLGWYVVAESVDQDGVGWRRLRLDLGRS